jgi:hypothetical protein
MLPVIMREGDTSQLLIWILKGQVSVHSHAKGHLCTIDSGFVGLASLITADKGDAAAAFRPLHPPSKQGLSRREALITLRILYDNVSVTSRNTDVY